MTCRGQAQRRQPLLRRIAACCGLLRLVADYFGRILRPLRLTGTALDGCQCIMPAQKLELRPISSIFVEVWIRDGGERQPRDERQRWFLCQRAAEDGGCGGARMRPSFLAA